MKQELRQKTYKTKSMMVADGVRRDIIAEVLPPGTRLVVSEVAKQYNVSLIPVREAFQVLVQEGYINAEPNTEFIVSTLSQKDIKEIFDLRIALEELCISLASDNITPEQVSLLQELHDDSRPLIDADDFIGYWNHNRRFHYTLFEIADNSRLNDLIHDLYRYSKRYPAFFTDHDRMEKSYAEHQLIINALSSHNIDLARVLIRTHTIDSYKHVLEQFKAKEESQAEGNND